MLIYDQPTIMLPLSTHTFKYFASTKLKLSSSSSSNSAEEATTSLL